MPTILLRSSPNFARAARLEIPLSAVIEALRRLGSSKQSGKAGPEILAVDWKAMPRRRKLPAPTWAGPRHHHANPANPAQTSLQSQSFEVVGRLREQGMNHLRSNWLWVPRGRLFRDMRSNTCHKHRRRVADLQESALYKLAEFDRRQHWVLPMTESHSLSHQSVFR